MPDEAMSYILLLCQAFLHFIHMQMQRNIFFAHIDNKCERRYNLFVDVKKGDDYHE